MNENSELYSELAKHIDSLSVGYPKTKSGAELEILKHMFLEEEAKIALKLTDIFEPIEIIYSRFDSTKINKDALETQLQAMSRKGTIFWTVKNGINHYSAMNFIVGMYEMQIQQLDPQIVKNLFKYYKQSYGLTYLSTEIPQMRVIPIEQSVLPSHNIASYDEVRTLINNVKGPICISNCICRTGMETLGNPCKKTHRKETCMGFNRFAEQYIRNGWGRAITKEEALDIIRKNEKEGLILEPSNNQDIEFLCSCCSDCCGMMILYKSIPRPADFIASNFQATVLQELCTGCGVCTTRCVMKAPNLNAETKKARVNLGRCIGCGVCVPTCKVKAINLIRRSKEEVPPADPDALYNVIRSHKNKKWQKLKTGLKIVLKLKR